MPPARRITLLLLVLCAGLPARASDYAVLIARDVAARPEWKAVADALVEKRGAEVVLFDGSVTNTLPDLRRLHPRYTALVAPPENLGRLVVARLHRLARQLDDDPYSDTLWGIVSAATAGGALRVARATEPHNVHSSLNLTGVQDALFDRVCTLSDGYPVGDVVEKRADGSAARRNEGDADRVQLFAAQFAALKPEAIISSGHATERNLEMPFSKGNTQIRDGRWCGMAGWKTPVPIEPDATPRVFVGAGNCLIGNFRQRADSMAPVLLDAYGFNQFVGYTVPTWYGKGGWGTLGLWQHLAGRLSLAEAWFFNNQRITRELLVRFPMSSARSLPISEQGEGLDFSALAGLAKDESGMLWDRDTVAFYGDPALRVTVGAGKFETGVATAWKEHDGQLDLVVTTAAEVRGAGGEPLCAWLPRRLPGARIVAGAEYEPFATDDFIVIGKPDYAPGRTWTVSVRAP